MRHLHPGTCLEWEDKLVAGRLDDLSYSEYIAFKEHLLQCSACDADYRDYLLVGTQIRSLPLIEPTSYLSAELLRDANMQEKSHPFSMWRNLLPQIQLRGLPAYIAAMVGTAYTGLLVGTTRRLGVSNHIANALLVVYFMLATLIAGIAAFLPSQINSSNAPASVAITPVTTPHLLLADSFINLGHINLGESATTIIFLDNTGGGVLSWNASVTWSTTYTWSSFSYGFPFVGIQPSKGKIASGERSALDLAAIMLDKTTAPTQDNISTIVFAEYSLISFKVDIQSNGGNGSINGSFTTGQRTSCLHADRSFSGSGPSGTLLIKWHQKDDAQCSYAGNTLSRRILYDLEGGPHLKNFYTKLRHLSRPIRAADKLYNGRAQKQGVTERTST